MKYAIWKDPIGWTGRTIIKVYPLWIIMHLFVSVSGGITLVLFGHGDFGFIFFLCGGLMPVCYLYVIKRFYDEFKKTKQEAC